MVTALRMRGSSTKIAWVKIREQGEQEPYKLRSEMEMKGVGTDQRTWVIMCADQRIGSDQGLGTVLRDSKRDTKYCNHELPIIVPTIRETPPTRPTSFFILTSSITTVP